MQKWKKRSAVGLALLMGLVPLSACGEDAGEDSSSSVSSSSQESVEIWDGPKTELNVSFIDAGFGSVWTEILEKGFEEKVKNISFEEGRKGVDVVFNVGSYNVTAAQIASDYYDVYFMENPNDVTGLMKAGALEPLDTLINVANPDDNGQKIVDKVPDAYKTAYNYGGNQYFLPYYIGAYGIVYNKEIFDENGFYFAATPGDDGNLLIDATRNEKSVGPDGKKGTVDDGLPTTYDEFFYLCEEIYAVGIDPVGFTGKYSAWHLEYLMDALIANYEGAAQTTVNYTYQGTMDELVVYNADGTIKKDNGKIVTESLSITPETGYETVRHISKYYALQFVKELFGEQAYYSDAGEDLNVGYLDMQRMFLENGLLAKKEIAMTVDGAWWQREAGDVFTSMAKQDDKYAKENRDFGWMPLPQPTQEMADKIKNGERKTVFSDQINGLVCVKAGLRAPQKDAALALLQYAYSDEALTEFTYSTGTTIGVDYFDALDEAKMSPYTRSYVGYLQRSDIVYPISTQPLFMTQRDKYRAHNKYKNTTYVDVTQAFMHDRISVEEFFTEHKNTFKNIAWQDVTK